MTSSKITAMATLALALVLIGSIVTGHLFVVYALLPDTASIKITSPPKGQAIPVGNLTISGTSSDNITTNCQVYAGWNDLKPYYTAVANGAGGADDYLKWAFTYTNTYHAITNGTNKLTAKLSCDDSTGSLAKWYSVNVTGVTPVVASSQSISNTTKLFATIQGQQNSTDKLQEAIFRSLNVQVPTISEINKISIRQIQQQKQSPLILQQQQGITPQELQNALKISLDNLSPKQKSMLTQPQRDLLKTMTPIMQKDLSPQQGIQLASLFQQSTKRAMGPSYDIFDQYGGAVKFGIKLGGLYDSGKLNPADIVIGTAAIILSSQTGLSPDVLYDIGRNLFPQSPSTTQPTNQVSKVGPLPTASVGSPKAISDKGGNNVEIGGYQCTKEGCGDYEDGICKTCGKPGADKAQIDAIRDTQGLNGHSYYSSCPSGHSAAFCGDYQKAYDKQWDDLHPSVVTPSDTGSPISFLPPSAPPQPNTELTSGAADRAVKDAGADAQGSNGHGYDSSCPSGHSAAFCGDYQKAYDKHWEDLHSSVVTPTSNSLTTEKPTTTAEQPIPTPDKSFQSNGVQQQLSVPQKSEPPGQATTGTPSIDNPTTITTINPTTTSGNELKQQGLAGSNTPITNPSITSKQDTGTALSSGDPNSVVSNTQPLSTTPDQSVSGVQSGQGGGSAAVAPDQGQTATTSQDQGTSGSGSTDGSSGGNSLAPDTTTTQSPDNNPTISSTTPDQSVSGVQPGQGGGSAVLVPDKGQTTATTSQDQGTSGSGGSDDNSGSSGSPSGDSSTTSHDNNPSSDSSSTADRHSSRDGDSKDSSGDGDSSSGKHRHSSNSGDSSSSGDDG